MVTENESRHSRRRQHHRLAPACTLCRERKIRCDRARPCLPCTKSRQRCRYDAPSAPEDASIPGQHVFSVRPSHRASHANATQMFRAINSPQPQLQGISTAEFTTDSQEENTLPSSKLTSSPRLLWHGSRATDQYTSPFDGRTISVPKEVMFGEDDATVFWGRTHETNFVTKITDTTKMLLQSDDQENVTTLYQVERRTRPKEATLRGWDPELLNLVPSRKISDRLWGLYAENFESYHRILHIPSFEREYEQFWNLRDVQGGSPHFLAQLLGICAIASCFEYADHFNHETRVRAWIETVRVWLLKQDPRAQMTLGMLQAHLLMLVAGDLHWIKIDRSWISSGILVRNAISAGLHREPRDFIRISPFHAELRRQLWYSILEYDLQASFAKGRMPSVREDEFDCDLPKAQDDSVWYILNRSLTTRRNICREVNSINLTLDYEGVLSLDAKLRSLLPALSNKCGNKTSGDWKETLFRISSQRATIALHAPFVARCLHDPKWSYSRARCLETATAILSEALHLRDRCLPGEMGPFVAIANICRCEISNSVFLVTHDLLLRAVEQRGLATPDVSSVMAGLRPQDTLAVVELVEKVVAAFSVVAKPDIVSQRTAAWMRMSAEHCRAAAFNSHETISTISKSIQKSIHEYRLSLPIPRLHTSNTQYIGDVSSDSIGIDFEGAANEDVGCSHPFLAYDRPLHQANQKTVSQLIFRF
ncbi:hypothetical protein BX600DRAFT_439661 [Xylariales sp. PMI_506]|nr:hypothetical protein BX600DRAFT_439661 [Xylariales sp. PMI_506]